MRFALASAIVRRAAFCGLSYDTARGLSYQRQINLILEIRIWRLQMAAAIARVLSHISGTRLEAEALKTIAMFCGVGLFVSLLFATYGLDLSAGVF